MSELGDISVHELAPAVISVQVSLLGVTSVHDSEPGVIGLQFLPCIMPLAVIVALPVTLPTPYKIALGEQVRSAVPNILALPEYSTPPKADTVALPIISAIDVLILTPSAVTVALPVIDASPNWTRIPSAVTVAFPVILPELS